MAGACVVFALLILALAFWFSGNTQTDSKIFTVTFYVRPGTNRLPLVPYENALELHKNVDFISWYIQHQGEDNTWIGGGRVDENGWEMSMASGYEERYSVLRGNGTLEIQNVTSHDDGGLYLGAVLGEYKGQLQYRLKYFDPNAETANGMNLTSLHNNCSGHNNSSSPVDDIEPPKEKCIGWIVACMVLLALSLCFIGYCVISCYHRYTHNFPAAVAKAQMNGSSGGEKYQGCDSQRDGRGTERESEMESLPNGVSETLD